MAKRTGSVSIDKTASRMAVNIIRNEPRKAKPAPGPMYAMQELYVIMFSMDLFISSLFVLYNKYRHIYVVMLY